MSEASTAIQIIEPGAGKTLRLTPLSALHRELGAKLVPFAGYEMPLHYAGGIVKEHNHVRSAAGLFDVSHMGQAQLEGQDFAAVAAWLESLVPGDIVSLKPGRLRYTQLLNARGGIIDDLMVARDCDGCRVSIVVNASRKEIDFTHIAAQLPPHVRLMPELDRALLALQGPKAAEALSRIVPGVATLRFLESGAWHFEGEPLHIARSGYTGEDGFEVSVGAAAAERLARRILAEPEVLPIGLGARDTLRLEAGLCLYGQDMDETTSPVEAGLSFSIGKRRRAEGGFAGAERVQDELERGPSRIRVGLKLEGRSAARPHMKVLDAAGSVIGEVTSGAFTPTAAAPVAMAYVPSRFGQSGTELAVEIRGTPAPARVIPLPFVPHRYVRQI
jgi:aminomethyltransferase